MLDSALSNYVLDVEARCHYHCLPGPGKRFLDHQQRVAHHNSLSFQIPARLESVEGLRGATATSAKD